MRASARNRARRDGFAAGVADIGRSANPHRVRPLSKLWLDAYIRSQSKAAIDLYEAIGVVCDYVISRGRPS
jgi:hypothetical protein